MEIFGQLPVPGTVSFLFAGRPNFQVVAILATWTNFDSTAPTYPRPQGSANTFLHQFKSSQMSMVKLYLCKDFNVYLKNQILLRGVSLLFRKYIVIGKQYSKNRPYPCLL